MPLDNAFSANVSVLPCNKRIVLPAVRCENTPMSKRRIYDEELHAQFVTFSC